MANSAKRSHVNDALLSPTSSSMLFRSTNCGVFSSFSIAIVHPASPRSAALYSPVFGGLLISVIILSFQQLPLYYRGIEYIILIGSSHMQLLVRKVSIPIEITALNSVVRIWKICAVIIIIVLLGLLNLFTATWIRKCVLVYD